MMLHPRLISVEQIESCGWTSRGTQTLYWPSKMIRSTLGSSTLRQWRGTLCLKWINKYMIYFRDHMQEVYLLGNNIIWPLLLLYTGKTKIYFQQTEKNTL